MVATAPTAAEAAAAAAARVEAEKAKKITQDAATAAATAAVHAYLQLQPAPTKSINFTNIKAYPSDKDDVPRWLTSVVSLVHEGGLSNVLQDD